MAEMYIVIHLDCADDDIPHWCLWSVDDNARELIFEALGSTGETFRYHSCSVDMDSSLSPMQKIRIGRIEADIWHETPDLLATVPVNNQTGWNCQNWVMGAIEALKEAGHLEEDDGGLASAQRKYQKKRGTY